MSLLVTATASGATPRSTSGVDTTGAKLLVIVANVYGTNPTITASDSKGNTWQSLTRRDSTGSSADKMYCRLFYCINPVVGSGHTFTVSGGSFAEPFVYAFSDSIDSFLGESGAGSASNSSIQPGSIANSAQAVFVGGICLETPAVTGVGSSFNLHAAVAGWEDQRAAYKYSSTAENPTWSLSGNTSAARGSATAMAAFLLAAPDITTTTLPNGTVDVAYSETLAVTGGTGSITWAVTVGALPDGLTLNSSTSSNPNRRLYLPSPKSGRLRLSRSRPYEHAEMTQNVSILDNAAHNVGGG